MMNRDREINHREFNRLFVEHSLTSLAKRCCENSSHPISRPHHHGPRLFNKVGSFLVASLLGYTALAGATLCCVRSAQAQSSTGSEASPTDKSSGNQTIPTVTPNILPPQPTTSQNDKPNEGKIAENATLDSLLKPLMQKDQLIEILLLELEHAAIGFSMDKSLPNYSRILRAYERLVERVCFRNLTRTLEYSKVDQEQPACMAVRRLLIQLHPINTLAICAEKGFEAKECLTASSWVVQKQTLKLPTTGDAAQLKKQQEIKNLSSRLSTMRQRRGLSPLEMKDSTLDPRIAWVTKLIELSTKLIQMSCTVEEFGLQPYTPNQQGEAASTTTSATPVPSPSATSEAFAYGTTGKPQEKEASSDSPEPLTPQQPVTNTQYILRVRFTTRNCADAIAQARSIDGNMGMIQCGFFGFYSPQCIAGLKADRKRKIVLPGAPPEKGATPTPKPKLFSEF